MNILVIGSGGREHALCWAIRKSALCSRLYCAPGNGGIADVAECVALPPADFDAIVAFVREKDIGFVVVGPEDPLVNGLVDRLDAEGIASFGPSAKAAQLEGSKGFTKDLCADWNIPTAAYGRFSDAAAARAFIAEKGAPIVVKADGLAAGKGVIIAMTAGEANAAIDAILGGRFGAAGAEVVIEEFLEGEEASFFALCDGTHVLPLATAQDHKRVFDNDEGPNTGGMGAYSPAPVMTPGLSVRVMREIIEPTVKAMREKGMPFKGVLYAGLMITAEGPKLIEYNARFGDPECQVLMMRLDCDVLPLLMACHDGTLDKASLRWKEEVALTVVMAAQGYPGDYRKNTEIRSLAEAGTEEGVEIFHAGTKAEDGRILSTGGRVLNVTATGRTTAEAQARAYRAVDRVDWPEGFCRRDIGYRAIEREEQNA
ncbi:phosphoribosylamine--glycine ligase [Parvibaculum sp.]|jgi:phosphoribosylamine--glycine ligase|uniref:phosphoribosylamine--glycine ligase n=3 Tax=Parvibaculum sp. TaxID=2024848 RepID=UPI001B10DA7D|nr:phosphoribosylamine--glycine ligase [Parvibaculum sp.]MBO6633309.1 phosphoribosylamine--glycine ligase [Parvibaculum sp.]MBO6678346.1 phosphoribosylamine--glycine ligase [Parvibaculum sp.]MBO6906529.1 phosphoribosylamine--glycine ligase [Parvibaculum sp.]